MIRSKDMFSEMQAEFLEHCDEVENGELSYLDCAIIFKKDMDIFEQLTNERKVWLNENVDDITNEADNYTGNIYNGFKTVKQTRETLSYKSIPEWVKAENSKKEIEEKSKLALQMVRKGIPNVDAETGEEIPLPEIKVSSFIKMEKQNENNIN